MVKHTLSVNPIKWSNCVFDHFVELALIGLIRSVFWTQYTTSKMEYIAKVVIGVGVNRVKRGHMFKIKGVPTFLMSFYMKMWNQKKKIEVFAFSTVCTQKNCRPRGPSKQKNIIFIFSQNNMMWPIIF